MSFPSAAPTVPSLVGIQTQNLTPAKIMPYVVNLLAGKLTLLKTLADMGFVDKSDSFPSWCQIPVSVRDSTALHKINGFGMHNIPLVVEQAETASATVAPAFVVSNWAVTEEEQAQIGKEKGVELKMRRQAQAVSIAMRNFEAHLVGGSSWGQATANIFGLAGFQSFDGNVTGVNGILQGASLSGQTGSVQNLARGAGLVQGTNPVAAPFDWLGGWNNVFRDLAGAFSTNILTSLRSAMEELDAYSLEEAGDRRAVIMSSANKLVFDGLFTVTAPGVALGGGERWTGASEATKSVTNGAAIPMYAGKYPILAHPKVNTGAGDTKCGAMIINPGALKLKVSADRWGRAVGANGTLPLTIIESGMIGWRGNLVAKHLRSHAWLGDPG